jgi:hypothetical protein
VGFLGLYEGAKERKDRRLHGRDLKFTSPLFSQWLFSLP